MNRAERIFRLHKLLKSPRPVPLSELMAESKSSRATVVRDLGYMRDFMEAPILYNREVNGYAYDAKAPEFELPGLWFNAGELYALLASEQLLETVQPGLLSPYIVFPTRVGMNRNRTGIERNE
jgi:predicted DNA-binding transcriptional regulator YafY